MDMFDYFIEHYKHEMETYVFDRPFQYTEDEKVFHYYGRIREIEFLNRIYKLADMPSNDSRVDNFQEEISLHTLSNKDWSEFSKMNVLD